MKARLRIVLAFCAAMFFHAAVQADDYFVSKQGNDTHDGCTQGKAFRTIQKGVDALSPGDTLTIGPGEYFENVQRENLGGPDADTIIRAQIPGTVLMRGDVEAPTFEPVPGYRIAYVAAFDKTPVGVLEHDTLTLLPKRPNMRDVEYEPGTFYYDEAQKKLYISSSDVRGPGMRRYTVAVSGETGLDLTSPQRVTIEGIGVTGYYPGWGIGLSAPVSCVVRSCTAFMCKGGISVDGGSDNIIENCESYAHTFGGIVRYRANNDVIRNCYTYRTKQEGVEHFGIMHYFGMNGPLLISNNISWGQSFDFSVKPSQQERFENNVALGHIRNSKMFNNLAASDNEYDRDSLITPPDNILFLREKNLDPDFEFADPLNLDYRLQADSRFRGTAPDGSDRGPYQYEANIFYVSPNGDDEADGLSMRKPWQTLERAFTKRRPGDTVYLTEGEYAAAPLSKAGDGDSPIMIRGRGHGAVVIAGKLNLTGDMGVALERLNFSGGVALSRSSDLTFDNCTFSGTPDGLNVASVKGLRATHNVFMNAPVSLKDSNGVFLSGNLYANAGQEAIVADADSAILYSDYNSYQDAVKCWTVNGTTRSFADLQTRHDSHSQTLAPEFMVEKGVPHLENVDGFTGRGPGSTTLGLYSEIPEEKLGLSGPYLYSVGDTTANIEWWTSRAATFELAWGETPEMTHRVTDLRAPDRFTTFSLTGLKPGTTYYFKILSADSSGRGTEGGTPVPALKPDAAPLSFTTLAVAPEPKVYYVATDGDDTNTGSTRDQAWRTVSHAADVVHAGDTVLIAEGTYKESVRIRVTGDEGRPITFKCAPGEKVTFNGENLIQAFKVVAKKYINFDGFYFDTFGNSMSGIFVLWQGDNVQITRCFNVKGTGNVSLVSAQFSADLLVRNCVSANGFSVLRLHMCPGWCAENNLFLRPWIAVLDFVNKPEHKGFFRKNICTDNLPYKLGSPLFAIGRIESFVEQDNCYFLRVPDEGRKTFQFYGTAAYARYEPEYGVTTDFAKPPVIVDHPDGTENNPEMTLKQYQEMAGDTGSYVGDPKLAGAAGGGSAAFEGLLGKRDLDFPDTFATDPKAIEKGIGPQPDAFKDFWFNKSR